MASVRLGRGTVASLVSRPVAEMPRVVASDPGSPLAAGLHLDVVQRIDV